jgi:hypothetical protein
MLRIPGVHLVRLKHSTALTQRMPYLAPRLVAQGMLDDIELQVATMELPEKYTDRWYTLREHCALAREKLLSYRAR